MESARYAIDKDDDFYLTKLPTLISFLDQGITLFVDKDFPPYHDMTLVQYSIAKRKPKCLVSMLKILRKDLHKKNEDIMLSKTSNTRGSLLKFAIEFCSKCQYYQDADNTCLEELIKFAKDSDDEANNDNATINPTFDVDLGENAFETPLIKAIRGQNNGAIEILMQNGANILHPLPKEAPETGGREEIQPSEALRMPIMSIFKIYNDEEQLYDLFGDPNLQKTESEEDAKKHILGKYRNEIFLRLKNTNIDDFLQNLDGARNFVTKMSENAEASINILEDSYIKPETPKSEKTKSTSNECSYKNCHKRAKYHCDNCNQNFCEEHRDTDKHDCHE